MEHRPYTLNDLKRIQKEITDRRMDRQNQTRRNPAKQNTVRREGYSLLNRPSEWTVKNIDEVAAVVREKLWAEGASAFWNVYRDPFSDVPCNEVLRSIKNVLKIRCLCMEMDGRVREQFGSSPLGQFKQNWSAEGLDKRFAQEEKK